ncbi:zinc finger MYM-type protein 6 [Trichonephila inaurata madagascariensis]|uniref:Zinc finger MYM-type protein 6 n=1 Tax=Trichonephila inaurata madagascariensis TaxID=2747483 RepID=A0A8X7CAZ6_9ARAC|nr:zinc finger MYM-type protein 6 [Trichonephila inaurata madagascariensis]
MKPSKLLRHLNPKHPGVKDKTLEYFERKKREHEGQKKFLRATTSIKENALRASYLVANREAAVEKIAHVPLSADTVTRRIEEIAEDIEARLFERINASPWYALQVDESTDIDNKAILLAYVRYLYQEDVHENLLCALPLPTNTTGAELFK